MNEIKKTTGGCPIILAAKTLASAAAGAVVETVGVAGECLDRTPRLSYQLMRRNYYDNRLQGHGKVVSALEALGSGIAYSIITAGSMMMMTPFLACDGLLEGFKDGRDKGGLYALGQSVERTQELQEELLDSVEGLTHEADEKAESWERKSSLGKGDLPHPPYL